MKVKKSDISKLLSELKIIKAVHKDSEGRSIVNINISDDDGFLSVFSSDDEPVISNETSEFLEHSLGHILPSAVLHFVFKSDAIDEQERITYDKAIRNYYHNVYIEVSSKIRTNTMLAIIMGIISAIIFGIAVALEKMEFGIVFLNMLDVAAWVFMWEAVDIFAFRCSDLKRKRLRTLQIIKSVITFTR